MIQQLSCAESVYQRVRYATNLGYELVGIETGVREERGIRTSVRSHASTKPATLGREFY